MNKSAASLLVSLSLCALPASAQADIYPDTWVAVDDLGRQMPDPQQNPLKTDKQRTVGIFYVSWHADAYYSMFKAPYNGDVTKILNEAPAARMNAIHRLWNYPLYHWGEPEMGYFLSRDPWVIRRDISMLSDAGVDVLILDATNAVTYFSEWNALLNELTEMQALGNRVPKICFWVYNGDPVGTALSIYNRYYTQGLYRHLWFYWEGKPLFLYNQYPQTHASSEADYPASMKNFFTLRNFWWGYARVDGKPYVGTENNWSFGYDMHDPAVSILAPEKRAALHNGRIEQMCVTPAQHASTLVGKSWTFKNKEPKLNKYDMPQPTLVPWLGETVDNPEAYGIYFQQRWDEALTADPDFIYINDWNEWTAGKYDTPANFMRRNNPFLFIDQYNAEFNRTIQPALGAYTDNYYMQMVQNIRRYKGSRQAPVALEQSDIAIDGSFADWDAVETVYYDTRGDVIHRNYNGYGGLHYTDRSGRNDITRTKAAVTENALCFYAETADALTPITGSNWMLLFIDSDADQTTGWHGYEYVVNRHRHSPVSTTLMRWDADAHLWLHVADLPMAVSGNRIELQIPAELISADTRSGAINFKWADNPTATDHILDLCRTGDTAPNRRFAYHFAWNCGDPVSSLDIPASQPHFEAHSLGHSCKLTLRTDLPYTILTPAGRTVLTGPASPLPTTITLPAPGLYIITTPTRTAKLHIP